jgi:hypothetical protein
MSTATIIGAEEAEVRAAEIAAKIAELDRFLVEFPALSDAAIRDEVRGGRAGKAKKLEERKVVAESELPRLRSRLLAFQEITAEHQAEAAEVRREAARVQGDEIDAEEREALHEIVARFRDFRVAVAGWMEVQSRRQNFQLANAVDLPGYPESALDAIDMTGTPRTVRQVFERVYTADVEPESVGSPRQLQGWQEFV